eukprot:GFYU01000598.1.p1 GENE.GFYU01000598.1~~GFYU01000598.1.p1  ORF type:complete len:410 (-),score=88.46 GFYU01000598.1:168-1397(-)
MTKEKKKKKSELTEAALAALATQLEKEGLGERKSRVHQMMDDTGVRNSTNYDSIKVRVWLPSHNHYYVLSRFLLSRVLTMTSIPTYEANKISLELKKQLVDKGLWDVANSQMEKELFKIMNDFGYMGIYTNRYTMMTQFHQQRVPLLVVLSGSRFTGKSTAATQLASRLNLSTVLSSDVICRIMSLVEMTDTFADSQTVEQREEKYARQCEVVLHGIKNDIKKCFTEGKNLILEGHHLKPDDLIPFLEKLTPPDSKPVIAFYILQSSDQQVMEKSCRDWLEREVQSCHLTAPTPATPATPATTTSEIGAVSAQKSTPLPPPLLNDSGIGGNLHGAPADNTGGTSGITVDDLYADALKLQNELLGMAETHQLPVHDIGNMNIDDIVKRLHTQILEKIESVYNGTNFSGRT